MDQFLACFVKCFWFDVLSRDWESLLFLSLFSCLDTLLGSLMIDDYGLKLMIWDSYELGWQTNELCAFFWNEIRMVWSCKGLQQDFAEIRKVSAFLTYACMEIKRKLFFNPPSSPLCHYDPTNWIISSIWSFAAFNFTTSLLVCFNWIPRFVSIALNSWL